MENFKTYAKYYDAFYANKEYSGEVDFLQKVIKKYGGAGAKTILSLGCGTATHDILLAKKGFNILGIDKSKEMIAIAGQKAEEAGVSMEFLASDITRFNIKKKFDVAMAMFNVVGYMAENGDMEKMLKNTSVNVKKGGLLLFDCWYGPAVLKSRPKNKEKLITVGDKNILRKTTQGLDIEKSVVNIRFEVFEEKNGSIKKASTEIHKVRFWYLRELEYFLKNSGFAITKTCNFMDTNSKVSEDNWNMFVIAKKI
ncbi:class I SAM-dependent methyltransferase [Candidatus Parcubacteria bacterium]|nr:class I SAM-dependent methyltransferase [Candidatus Parcubacteria bacterium]